VKTNQSLLNNTTTKHLEVAMSNDKQLNALSQHLEWLKEQLQQGIDDGYSETWIFAYQIAIKNAESLIEKYDNEQQ
jgi:hypothetical protein